MQEILTILLQTVITVAVPLVAAFIVRHLNAKAARIADASQSQIAKKYVAEAADAVTTAVLCVSQTYVDTLKKSGAFTSENQHEALTKALEQAKSLLTREAAAYMNMAYGDLNNYLAAKIEAEVKLLK